MKYDTAEKEKHEEKKHEKKEEKEEEKESIGRESRGKEVVVRLPTKQ